MATIAPRPAWGLPSWLERRDDGDPCDACGGPGAPVSVCPGCSVGVCSRACARAVHGGHSTCAWYDRPAFPGEPASVDGVPWPCDGCGGELPPAAYAPVAVDPDGMTWHACSAACEAIVARRRGSC